MVYPEIQMKRAERDILSYILTYILNQKDRWPRPHFSNNVSKRNVFLFRKISQTLLLSEQQKSEHKQVIVWSSHSALPPPCHTARPVIQGRAFLVTCKNDLSSVRYISLITRYQNNTVMFIWSDCTG